MQMRSVFGNRFFFLGSQVELQKRKHLDPVIFEVFGICVSASVCVYKQRLRA